MELVFKLLPKLTSPKISTPMLEILIGSAKNKDYWNFFNFGGDGPTIVGK
jgi:hypothetical protein